MTHWQVLALCLGLSMPTCLSVPDLELEKKGSGIRYLRLPVPVYSCFKFDCTNVSRAEELKCLTFLLLKRSIALATIIPGV